MELPSYNYFRSYCLQQRFVNLILALTALVITHFAMFQPKLESIINFGWSVHKYGIWGGREKYVGNT